MQYPKGFLKKAYEIVRERGGLCIADEVRGCSGWLAVSSGCSYYRELLVLCQTSLPFVCPVVDEVGLYHSANCSALFTNGVQCIVWQVCFNPPPPLTDSNWFWPPG